MTDTGLTDTTELRRRAFEANRAIVRAGLVTLTFGNASAVDRAAGVFAIKPSGVEYDRLGPEDMVVVQLDTGEVVDGGYRPSSDTPTHRTLYRGFPEIGGIVHTHSPFAVAWAQASRPIPCFGTTHADHFLGSVPVTRELTPEEIGGDYESATGEVIVETIDALGIGALAMPGVLVCSHGPFTWGAGAETAVENAIALETVAELAYRTVVLRSDAGAIAGALLARHHERKHGARAYYGQR